MRFLFVFVIAIYAQNFTDLDALDQAIAEKAASEQLQSVQQTIISDTTVYVNDSIKDIYISDTAVLLAIEQIETRINSIKQLMYNNKTSKKILTLSIDDQIRYLDYLIKNEIKSHSDVIALAEQLIIIIDYQIKKMNLFLNTLQGNNRARIFLHIKKFGAEKEKILTYIRREL